MKILHSRFVSYKNQVKRVDDIPSKAQTTTIILTPFLMQRKDRTMSMSDATTALGIILFRVQNTQACSLGNF